MKTLKVLSTSAIVAALLATCGMTAFADEQPAIDQNVNAITLGEGEEESSEGEEEPEEDPYATFAEYFNDTEENTGFELAFVGVTKDGADVAITVAADTVLADLGLEDGEYVFTWTVDGKKVAIEVDVADGEVDILGEADDEGGEENPDPVDSEEDSEPAESEDDSDPADSEEEEEDDDLVDDEDDDEEKDDDVEYDIIDVVNAAKDAGVNQINVMTLRNFLILNDEYFDSDDYADFIEAINEVRDLYIAPIAYGQPFFKTPAELTDSERYDVYNALDRSEKNAIQKECIDIAKDHGVLLTWDRDAHGYPVVYGSMLGKTEDAGTKASSGTQVAAGGSAVKATGALPEEGTSSAAAFAGVALALAAAGVVIVARKNRA